MKKILILFYLLMSSLLIAEEITISYPKNKMGYHFYRDLKKGEYLGNYVDLLNEINTDNKYEFKYELDNDVYDEDIQIRKMGGFNTKYYYLETPYTQKVFIIGNKNITMEDAVSSSELKIGCLGLGPDEVKKIQETYNLADNGSIVFFKNETDAFYSLSNGKVDILLIRNFKESNSFSVNILAVANLREFIGVRKDREDIFLNLKDKLNQLSLNHDELLNLILKNRAGYLKYVYEDLSSFEEIKNRYKKLRVLVPSKDFIPYFKEKFFKKIGIVPYLMENIENFLGIPVEYVFSEDEDWDIRAVDFSRNNKTLSREYFRAKIIAVNHIYDSTITNYKQLDNLKIIKLKDIDLSILLNKVNCKELIEVTTLDEAFTLLKEKKGDVILGSNFLLTHYVNYHNYNKYYKISQSNFEFVAEMTFKDEELKDILTDLLLSFSPDEIEFISNTSIILDKPLNIWLITTDILIVVLIVFTVTFIRKHIIKRKLKEFIKLFVRIEDINLLKDNRSLFHASNVAEISKLIAKELKFRKRRVLTLEKLGLVHDVGLVFIPKDIILKKKTGVLTDKEDAVFREHTKMGDILLKGIGINAKKRKFIKYHHENLDGTGYLGISGNNLPLESRILRVADMYDRVVSWQRQSHERAIEILQKYKNKHFDPEVVDIISKLEEPLKKLYSPENQNKDIATLIKEFETILSK